MISVSELGSVPALGPIDILRSQGRMVSYDASQLIPEITPDVVMTHFPGLNPLDVQLSIDTLQKYLRAYTIEDEFGDNHSARRKAEKDLYNVSHDAYVGIDESKRLELVEGLRVAFDSNKLGYNAQYGVEFAIMVLAHQFGNIIPYQDVAGHLTEISNTTRLVRRGRSKSEFEASGYQSVDDYLSAKGIIYQELTVDQKMKSVAQCEESALQVLLLLASICEPERQLAA